MFCGQCGTENGEIAYYCKKCGSKLNASISSHNTIGKETGNKTIFYSKEWSRKHVFSISSAPCFDVMVDDKYLYLIKLPNYYNSTLGLVLGLIVANIIGAFIGSMIGESSDKKKRQWYRSAWVDNAEKLISLEFLHDTFLKVPLNDIKGNLLFKKNKFIVTYDQKKVVLGRRIHSFRSVHNKELNRFNNYIKKYVL